MKEYVIEIHDDRERFVRVAFKDKTLRDGIYRAMKEHATNVDFIVCEEMTTATLRQRETNRVSG